MKCKFAKVTQLWNLAQISVPPLLVSNPVVPMAPRVQAVSLTPPFTSTLRQGFHSGPCLCSAHTPGSCSQTTLVLWAVSVQTTPVLSLSLLAETQLSAPSPHVCQHTLVLDWGVQGTGQECLCCFLSVLSAGNQLLLSPLSLYLFQLISQLVNGIPRLREPFLFNSSLPGAQVLS